MVPTFFAELEKQAVSMGRTLAAVQRRVSQGATVPGGMMQRLEAGATQGLASTPRVARRTAMMAAEDGKAAVQTQKMVNNPVTVAARARLDAGSAAARSGAPGVHDPSKPLSWHYDHGPNPAAGMGYTRAHMDRMAGQSQVVDPKGLIKAPAAATAPTVISADGGTAVASPLRNTPRRIAQRSTQSTAVTAITPRAPGVAA